MFSIWSSLNSSLTDQKLIEDKLNNLKKNFKSSLNSYYKPYQQQTGQKENSKLKKNENELIKKFANYLNLDEETCAENYILYLDSPYNHFIISSDLLEKLHVDELFSAHFNQFVDFYYRERYLFLKNITLIISSLTDNSYLNYDQIKNQLPHLEKIKQIFSQDDLKEFYASNLKHYVFLCKEIKSFSSKKNFNFSNSENFLQKSLIQFLKELELILETMLVLVNLINIDSNIFQEILKEFNSNSIIKYLNSSIIQTISQFSLIIEQITNLHSFIIVKVFRLNVLTSLSIKNDIKPMSLEDKTSLLSQDIRNQINELIQSFGSNQKSSPIILTWSTLLYNLSTEPDLAKMITNEIKTLINRMFALALKENVFMYILDLLANELFKNQDLVWHLKQIIYELLNNVLHSFDENSVGENLKILYELCFFCMHKNEIISENFWKLCQQPDRDNLTILIFYSLETFPISFGLTLTFFSVISRTSPQLCKQVFEYLIRIDQFCEYFENLNPDEYVISGESIRLIKNRKIFDGCILPVGSNGTILSHLSNSNANSNIAHRMILQNQAVNWNVNFICFDLIQNYLNRINYAASQNCLTGDINVISIIQFIDSLFKYFFDIDDLCDQFNYDLYTKYMEMFVNSCFTLFTNLINYESPDSYRLISKLLELFNNISPNIYDKLINLLQQNKLIGHDSLFDKMNIDELFNNRLNLVKSSTKLLYLFKSQDYELIINYFKLIENLIKESGNNVEYMSPVCSILTYIFPEIFKWKNNMVKLNIELSLTCLNLLHTVLNTSLIPVFNTTNFYVKFSSLHSSSLVSMDQFCETILLNTECSESLLHLIYTAYECSQDSNYINEIKKLDNILMQSISLINRLIPSISTESILDEKLKLQSINESILYSLLIKSINQQNQSNQINENSTVSSNEIINKNNQFLLQLNLMMSQSNPIMSKNLTVLNTTTITDSINELNWFHLLTKIAIYKSNHTLDCLLFSIFKKISQITPRLFGSLLGPYTPQMHSIIISKLNVKNDGQIISTISEFLCSLIENQPGFFQILANIQIESAKEGDTISEKFIEGDKSVLKELFNLLNELESSKSKNYQDYYISIVGIFSVFYTIWSNRRLDYMNYCKQKNEFWKVLFSSLNMIKKDINKPKLNEVQNKNELEDETESEYLEYFGRDFLIQFYDGYSRFDEFIIEANIKSISYAFKIFSIELFELIYFKKLPIDSSNLPKMFNENIIEKNLIEKWLDFYSFQLKRDLTDEAQYLINKLENAVVCDYVQNIIKPNMSVVDSNALQTANDRSKSSSNESKKKMKSKILFDSVKMLLLLINKTTRLVNATLTTSIKQSPSKANTNSNSKLNFFQDKLSMKRIRLDVVLNSLVDSMQSIIEHFLYLNNILLKYQQEQQLMQQNNEQSLIKSESNFFLTSQNKAKKSTNNKMNSAQINAKNFITLKQSNEIVKQFHSISNTIMILITSIKSQDQISSIYIKQFIRNLVNIQEKLMMDDFNYFPAIINSIEACLLHLFSLNESISIDTFKSDDVLVKKFVSNCCKVFIMSKNNLEDDSICNSGSFKDFTDTFILNSNLIKFFMSKFDEKYWYHNLVECCMIQCLYSLFEKYIQNNQNSDLMYAILDMFNSFSNYQIEHLEKSDFNTRTCLLVSKLFEYSFQSKGSQGDESLIEKNKHKWSDVLRIYINIQTTLLTKLKYKYLKDSILFYGSYFETMVNIIFNLHHSLDINLLETVRSFSRYLSQISNYTKELLIHISNSMDNLERLFCSLIQLSIMKLSHIKMLTIKSQHSQQQSFLSNNPIIRINAEEMVHLQNLLFTMISLSLDSLFNFIPNFSDPNYMTKLDEYKSLLAFQLTPPSSFDTHSSLSFGSILWLIDHLLKILHRYEQISSSSSSSVLTASTSKQSNLQSGTLTPNKRLQDIINSQPTNSPSADTSPKKNVSIAFDESHLETKLPLKSLIITVLEKTLNFLMTQIIICDRQMQFSPRDKKMFKRELNSEINTIIQGLGRTLKRASQSTSQYPSKSPTTGTSSNTSSANIASNLISTSSKDTYEFFKSIQYILQQNVISN